MEQGEKKTYTVTISKRTRKQVEKMPLEIQYTFAQLSSWRFTMQVVVKTPRIDVTVKGKGINAFIGIIKKSIPDVQIIDDDKPQDIEQWDYFKKLKAGLTPARVLKIRRENAGLTQHALAEKCGIASANIALMETGSRNIGIKSAKKLAAALGCDAGDFVV